MTKLPLGPPLSLKRGRSRNFRHPFLFTPLFAKEGSRGELKKKTALDHSRAGSKLCDFSNICFTVH
jgi:hypothetical protein